MVASQKGKEKRKVRLGTQASLTLGAETPGGGTRGDQAFGLIGTHQLKNTMEGAQIPI